jgi:hypothetical protein
MRATNFTKLNPRQRKYIEGLAQGMSRQEAKRFAQYAETTRGCRIENSSVKAAFARLMRQAAPAQKIVKIIADGLDATETKFFAHEGKVTDQCEVIAWGKRRAYVELAVKYGRYIEND